MVSGLGSPLSLKLKKGSEKVRFIELSLLCRDWLSLGCPFPALVIMPCASGSYTPLPLRSFPGYLYLYLKPYQFPFHTAISSCVAAVHISISVCKEKDHNLPICTQQVLRRCVQERWAQAINNLAYAACHRSAGLGVYFRPGSQEEKQEFLQNAAFIGYLFTNKLLFTNICRWSRSLWGWDEHKSRPQKNDYNNVERQIFMVHKHLYSLDL